MKGWSKIKGCCSQAVLDGLKYAWVDSCCIDKTSSSELSEAINSMYQWYENSRICYVYLSDVSTVTGRDGDTHHSHNSEFQHSRWFTRGWTLQELIAPQRVVFYDRAWLEIGTRTYLENLLSDITGINPQHFLAPRTASVAQRISWASKRQVTRVEDHAYSLLGLFNVNMPPLYGEGWKAFRRLQLEILGSSDDESIFAWNPFLNNYWDRMVGSAGGLLAQYPADFARSGDIVRSEGDNTRPPYNMTNRGLRIEVSLLPIPDSVYGRYQVPLHCVREGEDGCLGVIISDGTLNAEPRKSKLSDWYSLCRKTNLVKIQEPARLRREGMVVIKESSRPSQTTVISVQQPDVPEGHSLQGLQAMQAYGASLALSADSLLHSDFSVFRERWYNCTHQSVSVNHVSAYSINSSDQQRIRTNRVYGPYQCHIVFLHFVSKAYIENELMKVDSEEPDSFVVVLDVMRDSEREICVDLLIPTLSHLKGAAVDASLTIPYGFNDRADRISREMTSGKSVSVAVRHRSDENGLPFYVLDITFDADGRLPWPELGRSIVENQLN